MFSWELVRACQSWSELFKAFQGWSVLLRSGHTCSDLDHSWSGGQVLWVGHIYWELVRVFESWSELLRAAMISWELVRDCQSWSELFRAFQGWSVLLGYGPTCSDLDHSWSMLEGAIYGWLELVRADNSYSELVRVWSQLVTAVKRHWELEHSWSELLRADQSPQELVRAEVELVRAVKSWMDHLTWPWPELYHNWGANSHLTPLLISTKNAWLQLAVRVLALAELTCSMNELEK